MRANPSLDLNNWNRILSCRYRGGGSDYFDSFTGIYDTSRPNICIFMMLVHQVELLVISGQLTAFLVLTNDASSYL
jgi:hypothetical protein